MPSNFLISPYTRNDANYDDIYTELLSQSRHWTNEGAFLVRLLWLWWGFPGPQRKYVVRSFAHLPPLAFRGRVVGWPIIISVTRKVWTVGTASVININVFILFYTQPRRVVCLTDCQNTNGYQWYQSCSNVGGSAKWRRWVMTNHVNCLVSADDFGQMERVW